MIGVVVPARDEAERLGRCLVSLKRAAAHPELRGEEVGILVVLDSCVDASAEVARAAGVATFEIRAGNVGVARATGARRLLAAGARWLAFTDADSRVAPDWLVAQLRLEADAVCGTISVADWSRHHSEVGRRFEREYRDAEGHRHIHGANLGISRAAYLRVGGFEPLPAHEDVALVRALEDAGARIAWSAAPRVVTSSRVSSRTQGGFADAIRAHYEELGVDPPQQ
jgi:glycosyltransferase involved in cell wall biosynthesis